MPTRRHFLTNSVQLAAGASLASAPFVSHASASAVASDRLNVGLIGCNNMGWSNLSSLLKLPDVACIALCDVDESVLNKRAAEVQKRTGTSPKLYKDFRKLLENKDVDAVIIGTPDHWHCLQLIAACQAGKDVYVEKPISKTIEESLAMVAAVKRYNRVVQVGQWQRSGTHWQDAFTYLQSGKLGTIRLAKAWAYMGYGKDFAVVPDEPVPAGVDYDMWLGPAPKRPFNKNRFHGSFRYFWDYAGGLMTDWGVHMIDMVMAGMQVTFPKSVTAVGGKIGFPTDADETPDTQQCIYEFDDFSMIWEHAKGIKRGPYNRDHGVAFIGNNGTLVIDRGKWEVLAEEENGTYLTEAMPVQYSKQNDVDAHTKNFAECIKSRKTPACSIDIGSQVAINAHLGNIAYRVGRKVTWDAAANAFKQDDAANALMKTEYRAPWKLPNV